MICMTCTFFAGGDLYDLNLRHNISVSATKDIFVDDISSRS